MLLQQGDSVGQSIAHLVQAMYQQVGLKFTLQTINQNDYFQNYVKEGKFQIGLWEWDDPPYPISGSQPVYQEPQGKNLIQNFGAVSSRSTRREQVLPCGYVDNVPVSTKEEEET
jgi:peptide/nickel transport system substrate-binding protein